MSIAHGTFAQHNLQFRSKTEIKDIVCFNKSIEKRNSGQWKNPEIIVVTVSYDFPFSGQLFAWEDPLLT